MLNKSNTFGLSRNLSSRYAEIRRGLNVNDSSSSRKISLNDSSAVMNDYGKVK
jgi:hypothetical protein